MSFPTIPAFVTSFTSSWEEARIHPALAWLEKFTKAFDSRESWSGPYSDWHTDDYTFIKPNGEVTTGGDPAFKASQELYSAFTSSLHEPKWACAWETPNIWYVVGEATVYGDFPDTGTERKRFLDRTGRTWDIRLHGMFQFEFVKEKDTIHDGMKLKRLQVYCDTNPLVMEMLKKGMIKADDISK